MFQKKKVDYMKLSVSDSALDLLEDIKSMVPRDYSLADWKYKKLKEQIEEFQSELSNDVDVCIALAAFGTSMIMQVTDIGYQNPDMLYFYGYINGSETQLIQHISQLNFALMAVKKDEPERAPRRIGFVSEK